MTAAPLLAARAVVKRVQDGERQVAILNDVHLQIAAGEQVALVGPSGSGKSSLLHILGALDPDYEGQVELNGTPLRGLSDSQLAAVRGKTFGFVFQAYNLLRHLSALENVLLPARFNKAALDVTRGRELLARVGLADKWQRRPRQLSGGERQRVAIARALYNNPQVIFCDEPTGNLDATTAQTILQLFARLNHEGVTLLIATHDENIAHAAHRTLRLTAGQLQ